MLRLHEDRHDAAIAGFVADDDPDAWRAFNGGRWTDWIVNKLGANARAHFERFAVEHWHRGRNARNETPSLEDAERRGWIRMSPGESIYHRIGEENRSNVTFVSPDGHHEAVFRSDGVLVTDPLNMGTYNYCDPKKDWLGHGLYDVIPCIFWGNSGDDERDIIPRFLGTPYHRCLGGVAS